MIAAPHRIITVDEYYRMAEVGILSEDERVELVNGEIISMSPIGSKHSGAINKLARIFNKISGKHAIISIQNPVRIDDTTELEPDVAILKMREDDYSISHPVPVDVYLLIEVSDSSLQYDRETKLPIYAGNSIPEVWIVNLIENKIEVHRDLKNGSYQINEIKLRGDKIRISLPSAADVEVGDIIS